MEVHKSDFAFSGLFLGGAKFPSVDSSRLKEEFHEIEIEGTPESGIHGHDLTLGTGSSNAEKDQRVKGIERLHLERANHLRLGALDAAFNIDGGVHAIATQPKKSL
jgi:hypothetical protein